MTLGTALAPLLLPVLVFVVSFSLEPRKFRTGLYFFAAVGWVLMLVLGWLTEAATRLWDEIAGAYVLLGFLVLLVLAGVLLGVFMMISGVTLVLREGFRIARLLSIVLGLALLAYLALGVGVVLSARPGLEWLFVLLAIPVAYFGFGFASFVLYGLVYPAWMERFGGPVNTVIVLGSGLIDGQVPPLLASRLRKGRTVRDRSAAAGLDPRMIASGGRGPDEPVAEAEAMRDYLVTAGVPAASVLVEDRSRNTEENLRFSAELMAEHGLAGPTAVVTNDFHALRAALLMRKAGLPGYSVGAGTARYYWPTAVIREYAAVIRDHFWLNAVLLAVCLLPVVGFAFR
ncbi:MAG: YdcF family protein [Propionibacteriaceae bacterium]|nr:YdcF family protein [Propionibacteriaceae bacterium]